MQLHRRSLLFICILRARMSALLVIWLACKGSYASSLVTTDTTTYYQPSLIHEVDSSPTKAGGEKEIQNAAQTTTQAVHTITSSHPRSNYSSLVPTETAESAIELVNTGADEVDGVEPNTEAIPFGFTNTESSSDPFECLDGRNCNDSDKTSNSEHRLVQPTESLVETAAGFNVGIIAGISALLVVIATLMGVVSFLIYRHFSWNRPQTLNDKFSNDESNGYIDDTVFRENSEEMYSLDNDSFLNSLEAMTIQNYWTDHVKHTKL